MFTEYQLGAHKLKNRIVRSATNDHMGNDDGTISNAQLLLYKNLAKTGIGTIITGHFGVDESYKAAKNQPLVTSDMFLTKMKDLATSVHIYGAVLYGQISHGGLQAYQNPLNINEIGQKEILKIEQKFVDGAYRLYQAGFDGVQLHLAHGYFLSNVLDETINLRTDLYGGSDENRFRMIKEIIEQIKEKCPNKFDIIVKLNAYNKNKYNYKEHLLYYAKALKNAGIVAIELSGMDFNDLWGTKETYYLNDALFVKKNVDIPIILVGGLYKSKTIQKVLDEGIDLASMSRAFLCEPDFFLKMQRGNAESKCKHCQNCYKLYRTEYKNCIFLPPNKQLQKIYTNSQGEMKEK